MPSLSEQDTPNKDAPVSPSVPRILNPCKIRLETGSGTKRLAALWRGDIVFIADSLSQRLERARHPELCTATAYSGFW